MTRKDIIELANQAGFETSFIRYANGIGGYDSIKQRGNNCLLALERFAGLVIAAERKTCDNQQTKPTEADCPSWEEVVDVSV